MIRIEPPDFSVVIPMYNAASTIEYCLKSVASQTLSPYEVIVVDDGSTDATTTIIERDFPHVRLFRQAHGGVGAARNLGFLEARTEWVALLDADDVWAEWHLEELARIVRCSPNAVLVATRHVRGTMSEVKRFTRRRRAPCRTDYFTRAGRDIGVVCSSSAGVRRTAALDIGGFGPSAHGEDLEFWARLALVGPVATSSSVTALYFENPRGAMASRSQSTGISPASLEELSPSMKLVTPMLDDLTDQRRSQSLRNYAAGRLASCVKAAVVRGDVESVRRLSSLTFGRVPVDRMLLFTLGRSAPELLHLAYRLRNKIRALLLRRWLLVILKHWGWNTVEDPATMSEAERMEDVCLYRTPMNRIPGFHAVVDLTTPLLGKPAGIGGKGIRRLVHR